MDPVAHSLIGASLAETRLRDWSPLAFPTLVLAANAPDIDAVTMLMGGDLSLGFRRGWTHGIVALALLPIAVTALVLIVDRAVARARGRPPHGRAAPLLGLAYLGMLTHPALDWLNTYGIRLFMPFSGEWFYGDALFIVDPWIWLLAAAPVVLGRVRSRASATAWVVVGLVATTLVMLFPGTPRGAQPVWALGLAIIVGVRVWRGGPSRLPGLAAACLGAAGIYILVMAGGSRLATRQVETWLTARGEPRPLDVMAGPVATNPFVRDIVVVDEGHYHFLQLDWTARERIRVVAPAVDRLPAGPILDAALAAPHVQGLRTWLRYPAYDIEDLPNGGHRVTISDVRYTRRVGAGLGMAVVELDDQLRVR